MICSQLLILNLSLNQYRVERKKPPPPRTKVSILEIILQSESFLLRPTESFRDMMVKTCADSADGDKNLEQYYLKNDIPEARKRANETMAKHRYPKNVIIKAN